MVRLGSILAVGQAVRNGPAGGCAVTVRGRSPRGSTAGRGHTGLCELAGLSELIGPYELSSPAGP